jgi:hypothetical protein
MLLLSGDTVPYNSSLLISMAKELASGVNTSVSLNLPNIISTMLVELLTEVII